MQRKPGAPAPPDGSGPLSAAVAGPPQGYLFSKPVPPLQLAELLQSGMLMVSPPLQREAAPVKSTRRSKRKRAMI